jgi:hypothetical protein
MGMSKESATEENRLSALAGIRNAIDETKALRATTTSMAAAIATLTAELEEAQRLAGKRHERICELLEDLFAVRKERDEARAERDQLAEQLGMRDQRDRDMQEIMRINNEVVRERDEALGTLHFCEGEWSKERGTMLDKIATTRKQALIEAWEIAWRIERDCGRFNGIAPAIAALASAPGEPKEFAPDPGWLLKDVRKAAARVQPAPGEPNVTDSIDADWDTKMPRAEWPPAK